MNRLFTLSMLCGMLLLGGGCTKEDLSDCRTKVHFKLSYTHNLHDAELIDGELASCGELFLYDAEGNLIPGYPHRLDAEELAGSTHVELSVSQEAARYTAVVWINGVCSGDYSLSGTETLSTHRIDVVHNDGQVGRPAPNYLGELLHGIEEFTTDGKRTTVEATVHLRRLTNYIRVTLKGAVSSTYAGGNPTPYSIQLTGSNGSYDSRAGKLPGRKLNYYTDYWHSEPGLDKDLLGVAQTLHLTPGDDTRLTVFGGGGSILYNELLVELLEKVYPIDNKYNDTFDEWLWRCAEYEFVFDANMVLTDIVALDWHSIEDIGGI